MLPQVHELLPKPQVCVCACVHECIYICMYVYVYVCMYVRMYVYIYINSHQCSPRSMICFPSLRYVKPAIEVPRV